MVLSIFSGMLTGIPFIFNELSFISLISLIPFISEIEKDDKSFIKGFLFYSFLNLVTMSFLYNMHPMEFMGLSGFKSVGIITLMYLFIIMFEGLIFGIFLRLYKKFIKNIWFFPFFYALFEFIKGLGELGLTLSDLYLSWYKNTFFIQSAHLFGSGFISALIVLINILIYKFLKTKKARYIIISLAVFFLNLSYGVLRINAFNHEKLNYNIALIQGNISSLEKWENNGQKRSFDIYKELSENAKKEYDIDAVIWPETVITSGIYPNSYWHRKITELSKELNIDIYTGAFYDTDFGYYNSLVAFNKEGEQYDKVYHKRHLIPLAENEYNKNGLKEGKQATVIDTINGKIGTLICIDSAYPYLSYKTKRAGCDYFVVVSNDSWFKSSFGVENHFAHSVFRAVENNKYVLRAGNTGISAVITPFGEIEEKIDPLKRGYIAIKGGETFAEEE